MQVIYKLDEDEQNWWSEEIKNFRTKMIKSPKDYIEKFVKENSVSKDDIKNDTSKAVNTIREGCWNLYLEDEVVFHREVIKFLLQERDVPKEILGEVIDKEFVSVEKIELDDKFRTRIADLVGDYAGRIMPYLYYLSSSTTNSRRSRSGKTFEGIVEYMMDIFEYRYENQSKLGTQFYKKNNVGKMVDCILPDKESYEQNRTKCMVVTMKTSLRERWQEVAEEISRTNIPHIYLLTVDDKLTSGVLTNIKQQNITIVTYDEIKTNFPKFKNIISFETFFKTEIPHQMVYWNE